MARAIRRRRREAKTDYKSRFALLKAEQPRLVVRKLNQYITLQIVVTNIAQDKVIVAAHSSELLDKGWPKEKAGILKSPAAYLTGMLLAKKAKGKVDAAIVDAGMYRTVHGSRIFAAVKGAIDGGLSVPQSESALPV